MNQKVYDWIAAQIEAARPVNADVNAVTPVGDAAATLLGRKAGQVFGMQLSPDALGPRADELAERCLSVLEEWIPALTSEQRDQVGALLRDLRLPALVPAPAIPVPVVNLLVYTAAGVENFETGDEVVDPAILARYDGATTSEFSDAHCLTEATGGKNGWWCSGDATLVYDRERAQLRCLLTLGLTRSPTAEEIARILKAIETELFFSGWGLNLDWEVEDPEGLDELSPSVKTEPIEHRLEPVHE
jgi:hypothetical protein